MRTGTRDGGGAAARSGRVVVGVGGSPASLGALRLAVAHARRSGRDLVAVLAWEPPEGEGLYLRRPDPQWARFWYEEARGALARAVEQALGGVPADLRVELRVVRARADRALLDLAGRPDDLIVVGARPRRFRRGRVERALRRSAGCPVLTVPLRGALRGDLRALRRASPADFGLSG
ncbi:universal stress protein [Streptomyces sp. SID5785]|uniref:universal stress protein n=1 Tax=Streptomyces sp. SID5785 TaxID=2690309 RepID=UPI00136168BB|nr:universal stress protein [Streptomyces sp. SID5785]MZD07487.1 universal stress protein [Streptomyces sp. SID5785]